MKGSSGNQLQNGLFGRAQVWVSSAFKKWSRLKNSSGLTGAEIGKVIAEKNNLQAVRFESTTGTLSDHYDPKKNTVRMSADIEQKNSVAAMAIVAHELGHAQQYAQATGLITLRSFLIPAVTISPQISYLLIFFGLIFNFTGLFQLGVFFFGLVVLFSILTLPVEIDASRRGLALLQHSGLMHTSVDRSGSKQVLTAAAATYLAAAITAVLQLLYYLSLARRQ